MVSGGILCVHYAWRLLFMCQMARRSARSLVPTFEFTTNITYSVTRVSVQFSSYYVTSLKVSLSKFDSHGARSSLPRHNESKSDFVTGVSFSLLCVTLSFCLANLFGEDTPCYMHARETLFVHNHHILFRLLLTISLLL